MLESMLHEPWGTESIACEAKDGDVSPTGVQRLHIGGSYADEGSRRRRRRERRDALAASHGSTQRNLINDQRGGDEWLDHSRICNNTSSNDGSWCKRWNVVTAVGATG